MIAPATKDYGRWILYQNGYRKYINEIWVLPADIA
jgi:hypothetical protein